MTKSHPEESRNVIWRLGTIGFAYDHWAGRFYPKEIKKPKYLNYYAQQLSAVELDTTFHATPPIERVQKWAQAVPENFQFCVKTPRSITHEWKLPSSTSAMLAFLQVVRHFGPKLGPVLIQFPPSFSVTEAANLKSFLAAMPPDIRLAIEFRHPSWNPRTTLDLLQKARCAWVAADDGKPPAYIHATTDFLFIRWVGIHEQFSPYPEKALDKRSPLKTWKEKILTALTPTVKTIYGFFGDDYAGYGPGSLDQFREIMSLPPRNPPPLEQPPLFP